MQRTVSFFEAIQMAFQKFADFSGRSSRSEYWWWILFTNLLSLILVLLFGETGVIISYACILVLFIPGLAVTVRRLHDTGRSGWYFFMAFIPLVGPFIMLAYLVSGSNSNENEYGIVPNMEEEQY